MSTTNSSTKVFTWASVASGKKQTQSEIEAQRAKVREQEAERKRQLLEKKKEQELRQRLIKEKREDEFAQQNAGRLAQIAKQEEEMAERFKRENGYWPVSVKPRYVTDEARTTYTGWACHRLLDVPRNVNERAMKFIEHLLVNFPEVTTTCPTVGDFKQVFMDAYIGYVIRNFGKAVIENTATTRAVQYEELQKMVVQEEAEYNAASDLLRRNRCGIIPSPPWFNKVWVFAKNVNFESCLWAMNALSKTFEMETLDETTGKPNTGFVKIASNTLPMASKLTWLTNLETYEGFPHQTKPVCKQKREQQEREREDEWFD
jgi:hypothetical protein